MAEVTEKITAPTPQQNRQAPGLAFTRHFSKAGVSPYDRLTWERRTASIVDSKGNVIFEQKDVEVPQDWSMTATNIVASKYLHGQLGTPGRETGVRQLVSRVAETIRDWGFKDGYFRSREDADIFHDELAHLLLNQYAAFNSPVWFNVGCDRSEPNSDAQNWHWSPESKKIEHGITGYRYPQCSACFINSVQDTLDSILTLAKTEGMLFKWGSGTGTNLSSLRGSMEILSGGGQASGPLSFMKGFDAFAGVIKSGGKTRRAAKMVILNIDHPDIVDFIECKQKEEAKAFALAAQGYDASGPDSDAYSSIFFQNANNSIRVTDEFMQAVVEDRDFVTRAVRERKPVKSYKARDLMHKIAKATWECGDPGMQYDTTINRWHTGQEHGAHQCLEPVLGVHVPGRFGVQPVIAEPGEVCLHRRLRRGILRARGRDHDYGAGDSGRSLRLSRPSRLARNSHDYRPLGLGYANLGALLMATGLPYDSDAGRDYAACLTAILCGQAYLQSARIAEQCPTLASATDLTARVEHTDGACPGYFINREPFLDVIRMHRASVSKISRANVPASLLEASQKAWDEALQHGEKFGYRNSQVTVLAPTGTIGFMMDCDTTGVEPDLALVKFKKLVGGGMMKIVNNTVPEALFKLGYTPEQAEAIVSYIDQNGTIEGAPQLNAGAPGGLRLRLQAGQGSAQHCSHGAPEDDGGGAAVHLRRHQQDDQHADRSHGGGDRQRLSGSLEAGHQGGGHLSRRLQAEPGDDHQEGRCQAGFGGATRRRRRSGRAAARTPQQAAARALLGHPQVQGRLARRLPDGGTLQGWNARRVVHHHGQGRLDGQRTDGQLCLRGLHRAAARSSAAPAGQQVCAHPL